MDKYGHLRQINNGLVAVRLGLHANLHLCEMRSVQVVVGVAHFERDVPPKMAIHRRYAQTGAVR